MSEPKNLQEAIDNLKREILNSPAGKAIYKGLYAIVEWLNKILGGELL